MTNEQKGLKKRKQYNEISEGHKAERRGAEEKMCYKTPEGVTLGQ